jgi:hypothetical protein
LERLLFVFALLRKYRKRGELHTNTQAKAPARDFGIVPHHLFPFWFQLLGQTRAADQRSANVCERKLISLKVEGVGAQLSLFVFYFKQKSISNLFS